MHRTDRRTPNQDAGRRAARPAHPDDGRDAAAWGEFRDLLDATSRGRCDLARSIELRLRDRGYGVQPLGGGLGLRLVLPAARRAS